jgi:hypothetical protein
VTIVGRHPFDMGRSISASIKYDFIPLSADHARLTTANPEIVTANKAASKTKFNGGGDVGPISQLHKR